MQSTSSAYGAGLGGPPRASAVDTSRRNFGMYAHNEKPTDSNADALGPVNLALERVNIQPAPSSHGISVRKSKLEEPPPDTLRWNPGAASEGSAVVARRRKAHSLVDEQQEQLTLPPQRAPEPTMGKQHDPMERVLAVRARNKDNAEVPFDNLRSGGERARSDRAVKHEETMRVRDMIATEKANIQSYVHAPHAGGIAGIAGLGGAALTKEQRVAALQDPRVQAALDQALNAPNRVAADQYKARSTTRLSAERKY